MILADAEKLGREFIEILQPFVSRAELAGSIRRRKAECGDVEVVAVPRSPVTQKNLHAKLIGLENNGVIGLDRRSSDGKKAPFGPRYYRLTFKREPLDLFLVLPPAQFGLIFTIRTGPAEFSHQLVTEALRRNMKVDQGQLFRIRRTDAGGFLQFREALACKEESDFFNNLGIPYMTPEERETVTFRDLEKLWGRTEATI